MSFGRKLMQLHFDYIYNPVYDLVVPQFAPYRKLQSACIDKFTFDDGDKVLCVGVGTGNEIVHILEANTNVHIVGVDCSDTALRKARKKALARGKEIEALNMDAHSLEFDTGSFDKALCVHLMEFVEDDGKATAEIIRVVKEGGQFVITYASAKEGVRLGINMLKASIRENIDSRKYSRMFSLFLSSLVGTMVFPPFLFRSKPRLHSRRELETLFSNLTNGGFQIEEYPAYEDFIVCGRK